MTIITNLQKLPIVTINDSMKPDNYIKDVLHGDNFNYTDFWKHVESTLKSITDDYCNELEQFNITSVSPKISLIDNEPIISIKVDITTDNMIKGLYKLRSSYEVQEFAKKNKININALDFLNRNNIMSYIKLCFVYFNLLDNEDIQQEFIKRLNLNFNNYVLV